MNTASTSSKSIDDDETYEEWEKVYKALITVLQLAAASVREQQQQQGGPWRRQAQALLMCLRAVTATWQHYDGSRSSVQQQQQVISAAAAAAAPVYSAVTATSTAAQQHQQHPVGSSTSFSPKPYSLLRQQPHAREHHDDGVEPPALQQQLGETLMELTDALVTAFLSQQCLSGNGCSMRQLVSGVAVLTRLPPRVAAQCLYHNQRTSSLLPAAAVLKEMPDGGSSAGMTSTQEKRGRRPLFSKSGDEVAQGGGFSSASYTTNEGIRLSYESACGRLDHDPLLFRQQRLLHEVERAALVKLPEAGVRECGVLLSSMLRLGYIPSSTFLSSCKQRVAAARASDAVMKSHMKTGRWSSSSVIPPAAGSSVRTQVMALQQFTIQERAVKNTSASNNKSPALPLADAITAAPPAILAQLVGLRDAQDLTALIDRVTVWTQEQKRQGVRSGRNERSRKL
jgi:hypothetical protein